MQRQLHKSVRMPGYDYSTAGYYFITLCSHNHQCVFGSISDDVVCLSSIGDMITSAWADIPNHCSHVELDAFVVMPNHVHGILVLHQGDAGDTASCVTTNMRRFGELPAGSLSAIIRSFKAGVTKLARESGLWAGRLWQPGFYEHVITTDKGLYKIREYILSNPRKWSLDRENHQNR